MIECMLGRSGRSPHACESQTYRIYACARGSISYAYYAESGQIDHRYLDLRMGIKFSPSSPYPSLPAMKVIRASIHRMSTGVMSRHCSRVQFGSRGSSLGITVITLGFRV